jgi:hypothetical protein
VAVSPTAVLSPGVLADLVTLMGLAATAFRALPAGAGMLLFAAAAFVGAMLFMTFRVPLRLLRTGIDRPLVTLLRWVVPFV